MHKAALILLMNAVKNVPMCHTSGSKGSQPHNIQAYRLVLKSLQMKGCVKHPLLGFGATKLPHRGLADRRRAACRNHLNLVQDFADPRAR